ncbi:MAG: uroporphyrinogen decarboxylase [Nitrospirales bacterium]|nr:uroporphyrinogen decarboxylase [Nitrospirales bacterium]
MNSIERIIAAVGSQGHDRVPVAPLVFGHAAVLSGTPLREYLTNGKTLAQCQVNSLKRYGYDAVFAFMDTSVEAEALGLPLRYREDVYPSIGRHWEASDLRNLSVPDPLSAGRMPEVLRAARILRQDVGNDVLVAGLVLGPMTLATQIMGMEKALFLSADEPERFEALLDFCIEVAIRFGTSQIEAGAHLPILFDPSACPEIVPPSFFRQRILPRLKRAFSAFMKAGAAANLLHIAGKTASILSYYPEAGVHIAGFDNPVKPEEAQKALPATCLFGNINCLSFMDARPEEIQVEASRLLKAVEGRRGFILSSGCEAPLETRPENLDALVAAVRG